MNTYEILKCDTCDKIGKRLILKDRLQHNKCNLTVACRGKLSKINESNISTNTETLNTWGSRFDSKNIREAQIAKPKINILNGANHISIAVSTAASNMLSFNFVLRELNLGNSEYVEYIFQLPSNHTGVISGNDHSQYAKLLKIDSDSSVMVFINDNSISSTAFTVSTDRVDLNNVQQLLNKPINVVKVYVYRFNVGDDVSLEFVRGEDANCAWGNVSTLTKNVNVTEALEHFTVYTCNNLSILKNNRSYVVSDNQVFYPSQKVLLLLGVNGMSNYDRDLHTYVDFLDTSIIYYYQNEKLLIEAGQTKASYPALNTIIKYSADKTAANVNEFNSLNASAFIN